jgi:hypothetical protein
MPSITGTVAKIHIDENFGCVTLHPSGGGAFTGVLWAFTAQTDDADRRHQNTYYLSLARDAMTTGRKLQVSYNTGSSLATAVELLP